jgi:hypothetical protein
MKWGLLVVGLTFLLSLPIMADNSIRYRVVPVNYCDGYAMINHFHSGDNGAVVFDQILFYEWLPEKGRHVVQAWYLLKNSRESANNDEEREAINERTRQKIMKQEGWDKWPEIQPGQPEPTPWMPEWRWPSNLRMRKAEDGTHYTVTNNAVSFEIVTTCDLQETWTVYDPELVDRDFFPKEKRHGFQERIENGKALPQ